MELINFDNWGEYTGFHEGSGRSEKIWLINNSTQEIGLFKFPKSPYTTEHISEKLSSDIANKLNFPCANIDIGIRNGRIGSFSHLINKDNETLIEGVAFISKKYPKYNPEDMIDKDSNDYYSLEMIFDSIPSCDIQHEFINLLLFDFLIGNTDRHQNNWAILSNNGIMRLCPAYDNGSSLCCYLEEDKIDMYLGNDKIKFNSLVNTKSKSRIRLDKHCKKEPTHLEVISYIKKNYYIESIGFVNSIINSIHDLTMDELLSKYSEAIFSDKRKKLIKLYVLEKIKLLEQTFYGKEK